MKKITNTVNTNKKYKSSSDHKHKSINVVLDLDNTLIYSWESKRANIEKLEKLECYKYHNMDNEFIVCERPGLQKFLDWLFAHFNVMIWSAASPDYVDFIVKNIVIGKHKNRIVEHVFDSTKCDESQQHYNGDTKNLCMLWDKYDLPGYGPYNTLIIDDMGHVVKCQPKNSIHSRKFIANDKDVNRAKNNFEEIQKKLQEAKSRFETTRDKTPTYELLSARKQ
jgi:hypothetical protein